MLNDIIFGMKETFKASDVLNQVTGLVPTLLPAVIGFIAFRKGWKFLRGALASA